MRKFRIVLLAVLVLSAGTLAAQTIQHETRAVNIEIPVRVFKGADFIDTLKLEDFEVFDNGRPQKLEAAYLVKKAAIERREETRPFMPWTARHFTLLFEMSDYDPRLYEGLRFFVDNVLIPGDSLVLITPMKTYRMRMEISIESDRKLILDRILDLLRRDILIANAEYRGVVDDLKKLSGVLASSARGSTGGGSETPVTIIGGMEVDPASYAASFEENLQIYSAVLQRLERMRAVDESKFVNFARYLKGLDGQKDVFLFYQREFIPKIHPKVLTNLMSLYNERADIVFNLMTLFDHSYRESMIDTDSIIKAFSNASTSIHFLFLSTTPPSAPGVVMEERTEDIFLPFREMARATGGFTETSGNFGAIMRAAVSALENYYLLYYTPDDYRTDGGFRTIEVRVKGGGYRVTHRAGYIAD